MGPLKFEPLLKRARWGGRRLHSLLQKPIGPETDYAESWEICDLGIDQTVVADGPWRGASLGSIVKSQSVNLFGLGRCENQFPLLIKFLDAQKRLSVQVHPNDELAAKYRPGARGKTEAWIILAAEPGSCVFAGLLPHIDQRELRRAISEGTVESCLHRLPVAAGDCVFIPAGTVHAIGEGIVLAEVQQSSNITFRLFDWNELGANGKPRELHIEESLAAIDFSNGPADRQNPILQKSSTGDVELLVDCPYFRINRRKFGQPGELGRLGRFRVIIALEGETACIASGEEICLKRGETALIPASADALRLVPHGPEPSSVLEVFG